jgi:hypothetical protein
MGTLVTGPVEVANHIQKFWSPMFMKELRESLLLGGLINRDYQGELKAMGDTVKVSQVNAPAGALKTVGTDAEVFAADSLSTSQIEIKADKRAVAAYEMEDLVELQSQIQAGSSDIRESLMFAVMKQLNDYLYTLVAPTTTVPLISDFNAGELVNLRKLAGQKLWNKQKPWYVLADPSYYADLLNSSTLTSSDFVSDQPVVGGQIIAKRHGFNILEDNSRPTDEALAFHPDFMHLVMQQEPRWKLSDLHPNKKFGFVLSVDMVFGAKIGIDGAEKHIRVQVAA